MSLFNFNVCTLHSCANLLRTFSITAVTFLQNNFNLLVSRGYKIPSSHRLINPRISSSFNQFNLFHKKKKEKKQRKSNFEEVMAGVKKWTHNTPQDSDDVLSTGHVLSWHYTPAYHDERHNGQPSTISSLFTESQSRWLAYSEGTTPRASVSSKNLGQRKEMNSHTHTHTLTHTQHTHTHTQQVQ